MREFVDKLKLIEPCTRADWEKETGLPGSLLDVMTEMGVAVCERPDYSAGYSGRPYWYATTRKALDQVPKVERHSVGIGIRVTVAQAEWIERKERLLGKSRPAIIRDLITAAMESE